MREVPLAIIGGGPAGICAAIEAAKYGVQTTLFEESHSVGGQIYHRLSDSLRITDEKQLGKDYVQGTQLLAELEQYREKFELSQDVLVWGIFPEKEIAFLHNGKTAMLKAQKLILAEGAYDRPMPFPGWTLPGAMTAGAALRLVKAEKVLPGERILLSGTGPLQLALAAWLVRGGATVVAVLEATTLKSSWQYLPGIWGQWELLKDGLDYLREINRAKVPLLRGHAIVEARGEKQVQKAIYAKVNRDGKPIAGTERNVEVDTIITGYGLVPSTRLSRLCGCLHKWHPYLGGWVPCLNDYMETTVPGIFAVGDCAGIKGAVVAQEEGRLAALRVCQQLGLITAKEATRRYSAIFKKLRGLRKFEAALNQLFAIRQGWLAGIADDVIACRCEEVTVGEIRKVIAEGFTNLSEIKNLTRAGMGPCQGRICEPVITEIIALATNQPIAETGFLSPRPPVKPLPFGGVAAYEGS